MAKKLGLKPNCSIFLVNEPKDYWKLIDLSPKELHIKTNPEEASIDFIHLFCTTMNELEANALGCKAYLKKTETMWVSWPKGSSKIPTDLKREPIRDHVLKLGLVDTKVAAINEDWSGLKFVYRLKDR